MVMLTLCGSLTARGAPHTIRSEVIASNAGESTPDWSSPTGVVKSASTPSPAITTERNIATGGTSGTSNGGNGWGFHKLYIARGSTGDLFDVYDSGTDDNDKTYHLMHCAPGCTTWSTVATGDGGREVPLLLVSPSNTVYLVIWNSGSPNVNQPRLVNAGVNGQGPITKTSIPGGFTSNDDHPYAAGAVDSSGNLYVEESTTPNLGGSNEDTGYEGNLAWTTGGEGHWTWHFTQLPGAPASTGGDYRHGYTYLLPDNHGGIDIVGTRDVSCGNTAFTSANGYSNIPGGFVVDQVADWHTDNLNATGGASWSVNRISQNTKASPTPGAPVGDCRSGGTVNNVANVTGNDVANDAYRDSSGVVHVLYTLGTGGSSVTDHAVLSHNGSVAKTVTIPGGHCDNDGRIAQDSTGRFYVLTFCSATQFYVFPGDAIDGTTLQSPTTLSLAQTPINYFNLARPQGGTSPADFLDMVYAANSGTKIQYVRVRLAS